MGGGVGRKRTSEEGKSGTVPHLKRKGNPRKRPCKAWLLRCLSRSLVPAWGIIRLAEDSFPSLGRKEELGAQRYKIKLFYPFSTRSGLPVLIFQPEFRLSAPCKQGISKSLSIYYAILCVCCPRLRQNCPTTLMLSWPLSCFIGDLSPSRSPWRSNLLQITKKSPTF